MELLHNSIKLINREKIIPVTHKVSYILSSPLKAMAQWRIHYMPKEVYLLSGPSELQPVADYITQYMHREKDLPSLPSMSTIQEIYQCTHKEFCFLAEPSKKKMDPNSLTKQTLVQHRQNTSWEPATVVSQSSSKSYWIMQENSTDQPRMYRRTRSMLKIRCTDIRQKRHNYSQLTETEKAKFPTPFTYNDERNFIEHNSVKKISDDLVHLTKSHTSSVSDSIFSEEREEIAEDIPAPTPADTLETGKEQPYTPGSRKSIRKNLGRPASTFSDFYM